MHGWRWGEEHLSKGLRQDVACHEETVCPDLSFFLTGPLQEGRWEHSPWGCSLQRRSGGRQDGRASWATWGDDEPGCQDSPCLLH